jgi:IS30 family transposase
MKRITQQRCNAIALELNIRPRKRHGFKSPVEVLCVQTSYRCSSKLKSSATS